MFRVSMNVNNRDDADRISTWLDGCQIVPNPFNEAYRVSGTLSSVAHSDSFLVALSKSITRVSNLTIVPE